MPAGKWYRRKGKRRSRGPTGSSLNAAWKRNNRKAKGGLVKRTAQANRREIKKIKGQRDVKAQNGYAAVYIAGQASFTEGQGNLTRVVVDNQGTLSNMVPTIPDTFACNLLELHDGDTENACTSVIMKSLAVQCWAEADSSSAWSQIHYLLVLDRSADQVPANLSPDILFHPDVGGPTGYNEGLALSYVNTRNVSLKDKTKRFAILAHKKITLGSEAYQVRTGNSVPVISTTAAQAPTGGTYYGNTVNNVAPGTNDMTVLTTARSGPTCGKTTLFVKSPYKLEYDWSVDPPTNLPTNQTIYLYAYQIGTDMANNPANAGFYFRANFRYIDP